MKSKLSHILFISLMLMVAHLTSVQAVTDAELEVLEKQIEQQEAEEKKRAEAKRQSEAEAEVEKRRTVEMEKQRREEQRLFEEEKRKIGTREAETGRSTTDRVRSKAAGKRGKTTGIGRTKT